MSFGQFSFTEVSSVMCNLVPVLCLQGHGAPWDTPGVLTSALSGDKTNSPPGLS